jgi:hypothetical protein
VVTSQRVEFDEQDTYVTYLKGAIDLIDGSILLFAQYVRLEQRGSGRINRVKYRSYPATLFRPGLR